MRIAINADYLAEPRTGTGRYLSQLVAALGIVDGVNDYTLLSPRPAPERPDVPSTFQWDEIAVSAPSDALRKLRWEQRTFPEFAKRREAQVLFVPHFAPPIRTPLPVITTIHDVIPFALPEYRPASAIWLYYQLVAQGARRAAMIITVTEHAKSEIMRYLNVPEERIVVIPEAPASQFRSISDTQVLQSARAKYRTGDRFILYLGGFDARKNVPVLVSAFAALVHRLNDPSLKLVISGDLSQLDSSSLFPDWRPLLHKFGITSRVVTTYISDADLPAIYSAAQAFVYPSRYEGFGLPPLEAMACGTPVVTSDHPALLEVVGNAGLTFSLGDNAMSATRGLADQLTRLLTAPELREDYRLRSLARARSFSWMQTAAETSAIFTEITGTRR